MIKENWQTVVLMMCAMLVTGALVYVGKANDNVLSMVVGGVLGLVNMNSNKGVT